MPKIGTCLKCGLVKTISSKSGLCRNCLQNISYGIKHPLKPKTCKWCGKTFTPIYGNEQYCSKKHRLKAIRTRYNQRHPKTVIYLGHVQCLQCGKYGSLFSQWRNSKIEAFYIWHSKGCCYY